MGYFIYYNIANDAKNEIRGMGYSDAFVVAIYNGEKITLAEARNLESTGEVPNVAVNNNADNSNSTANNTSATSNANTANGGNNTNTNNTTNGNVGNTNTTDNTIANNTTEDNTITNDVDVNLGEGAAKTKDADKIKGLYYTVQIGAFSKPIQAADVFNISPLVTKFIGNLYKYSTGIYQSVNDAVVRKNEVVDKGNTDAFVTAYFDGEKISLVKAKQLVEEQGESIFAADASGNLKQLQNRNTPAATTVDVEVDANGQYQVDLGTYGGEIPTDIANAMLLIPKFVVNIEKLNSNQRYYVGNFANKEDAQKVVDLYSDNGVEDLSILDAATAEPKAVNGVVFKVFLGSYQGEVPDARAITFVDLKDEGITKVAESNGDETYYAGEESLFNDAKTVLKKFTSRGVSIAEIKAFQDDVEIPLEEAKQLTGE